MRIIQAIDHLTPNEEKALQGQELGPAHYDDHMVLEGEDGIIFGPDGGVELALLSSKLSARALNDAFLSLYQIASEPVAGSNRAKAAGLPRVFRTKADGTKGKRMTTPAWHELDPKDRERLKDAYHGTFGALDRSGADQFCRPVKFGPDHDLVSPCLPLFNELEETFRRFAPREHALQKSYADRTGSEYLLAGTSFTTGASNLNWRTFGHLDAGDLAGSCGVMTFWCDGCSGGDFILPRFRCAARPRTGDVILANTHGRVHGNAPIVSLSPDFVRLSVITYYREHMTVCLSTSEERERRDLRKNRE